MNVITNYYVILCHRPPAEKCHGLHVSLQVEAFATFMGDIKCDESEVESKYIEIALKLMHQQSKVRPENTTQIQWTSPFFMSNNGIMKVAHLFHALATAVDI